MRRISTFKTVAALALLAAAGATRIEAGDGRLEISQAMMPVTIAQPGSYVVTENLKGTAGSHGITIATNDVTLDLNGFEVTGVAGSLDGIGVTGARRNVVVKGGVVSRWGGDGVDLSTVSNAMVIALQVTANAADGLKLNNGMALDCQALSNGADGIDAGGTGAISGCTARGNGSRGIVAGNDVLVAFCTARANGSTGISVGEGAALLASTARECGGTGLAAGAGSLVNGGAAHTNGAHGIAAPDGGVLVQACTAHGNSNHGISVGRASLAVRNSAQRNRQGGILVSNGAYVVENAISDSSGGVGIRVAGNRSRVDANHLSGNAIGIDVVGSDNVIVRNTAVRCVTNGYQIGGGNHFELDVPADSTPNKPWVNFRF